MAADMLEHMPDQMGARDLPSLGQSKTLLAGYSKRNTLNFDLFSSSMGTVHLNY